MWSQAIGTPDCAEADRDPWAWFLKCMSDVEQISSADSAKEVGLGQAWLAPGDVPYLDGL